MTQSRTFAGTHTHPRTGRSFIPLVPLLRRAQALLQISEENARVAAVGRQLFTQQTGAIAKGTQKVTDATPEIEGAIKWSERLKKFISGVSNFLGSRRRGSGHGKLVV